MALKGIGIDPNVYVEQTYYSPEDFTIPTPSQGDYFTPQGYVDSDYVLEALDLTATFTLQAEGEVDITKATLTSSFTMAVDGDKFDFASITLSSQFTVTAVSTLIERATATLTAQFTSTQQGNYTTAGDSDATASFTVGTQGNIAFDATATPDSVVTEISVGSVLYDAFNQQDDYTWDDFAESDVIDRTWNEWFGGKWQPGLIAYFVSPTLTVNAGLTASGTGVFTAQFTQPDTAYIRIRDVSGSATSQFTVASDYIRIRDADPASYNAEYTVAANGSILHLGEASISSAFTQPDTAFIRFRGVSTAPSVSFSTTQNANVTFSPDKGLDSEFTHQANANVFYTSVSFDLSALASTFNVGRLITLPDPWNTLTVPQELRTLVTPIDTRIIPTEQETRVNNTTTENRTLEVEQETRAYRIFKPQFTNRSSIPKVRTDL